MIYFAKKSSVFSVKMRFFVKKQNFFNETKKTTANVAVVIIENVLTGMHPVLRRENDNKSGKMYIETALEFEAKPTADSKGQ